MNMVKIFAFAALLSFFLINLCSIIYQNATEENANTVFYSVKLSFVNHMSSILIVGKVGRLWIPTGYLCLLETKFWSEKVRRKWILQSNPISNWQKVEHFQAMTWYFIITFFQVQIMKSLAGLDIHQETNLLRKSLEKSQHLMDLKTCLIKFTWGWWIQAKLVLILKSFQSGIFKQLRFIGLKY